MEALTSSFGGTSLGGSVQKLDGTLNVYISEVSSPTRLWIQSADSKELDKMSEDIGNFYKTQGDGFSVKPEQVVIGLKVAAFACAQWDRAEVISEANSASGTVKLFFMDYGTTGIMPLKLCRFLVEHFATMSRKAIRGALYGISPRGNSRLWDLNITHEFISSIRNKIHKIKIVIHHEHEDFYEFLLYDANGATINEMFINTGRADKAGQSPFCLSYPSFIMLEKQVHYPTYGDRIHALEHFKVNLNVFEEACIPAVTSINAFETSLNDVLRRDEYKEMKEIFAKLSEI